MKAAELMTESGPAWIDVFAIQAIKLSVSDGELKLEIYIVGHALTFNMPESPEAIQVCNDFVDYWRRRDEPKAPAAEAPQPQPLPEDES